MSTPVLLLHAKSNLHNIIWFTLTEHFRTYFKDYKVNKSVYAVCQALKNLDSEHCKNLQELVKSVRKEDAKYVVRQCFDRMHNPALTNGRIIVLLYFMIELCKMYASDKKLSQVDDVIKELGKQLSHCSVVNTSNEISAYLVIGCVCLLFTLYT